MLFFIIPLLFILPSVLGFRCETKLLVKYVSSRVFKPPRNLTRSYEASLLNEQPLLSTLGTVHPQRDYPIANLKQDSKHVIFTFAEIAGLGYCQIYDIKRLLNPRIKRPLELRVEGSELIYTSKHDGSGYRFILIENMKRKFIALSFRGSIGLKDWMYNLDNGLKTPIYGPDDALVSKGFERRFIQLRREIDFALKYVKKNNYKTIFIVGHSLGGAMAFITGVYVAQKYKLKVNVYTYGMPRLGNKKYMDYGQSLFSFYRVVNEKDWTPHFGKGDQTEYEYFYHNQTLTRVKSEEGNGRYKCDELEPKYHSRLGPLWIGRKFCRTFK